MNCGLTFYNYYKYSVVFLLTTASYFAQQELNTNHNSSSTSTYVAGNGLQTVLSLVEVHKGKKSLAGFHSLHFLSALTSGYLTLHDKPLSGKLSHTSM